MSGPRRSDRVDAALVLGVAAVVVACVVTHQAGWLLLLFLLGAVTL